MRTLPGAALLHGTQFNEYQEIALKASCTIDIVKLLGALNYSPNFFGRSGDGFYIEGGADVTLPLWLHRLRLAWRPLSCRAACGGIRRDKPAAFSNHNALFSEGPGT